MATSTTIDTLARQTARWSTASLQDEAPLIRLLHANYGVAYASALRQIASDQEIEEATGLTGHAIEAHAIEAQDRATVRAVQAAPELAPKGPLVGLAREGLPTTYGAEPTITGRLSRGIAEGLGIGVGHLVFTIFLAGGAGFLGFHFGRRRDQR